MSHAMPPYGVDLLETVRRWLWAQFRAETSPGVYLSAANPELPIFDPDGRISPNVVKPEGGFRIDTRVAARWDAFAAFVIANGGDPEVVGEQCHARGWIQRGRLDVWREADPTTRRRAHLCLSPVRKAAGGSIAFRADPIELRVRARLRLGIGMEQAFIWVLPAARFPFASPAGSGSGSANHNPPKGNKLAGTTSGDGARRGPKLKPFPDWFSTALSLRHQSRFKTLNRGETDHAALIAEICKVAADGCERRQRALAGEITAKELKKLFKRYDARPDRQ